MRQILAVFLIIFLVSYSFAQPSTLIGTATANEYAMAMCTDNAGNTYFGAVNNDEPWIFKQDVNNNMLWSQKLATASIGFASDVSYIDIVGDTIFGCGWLKTGASIKGSLIFKLNASTGAVYWVKSEATSKTYLSTMKYANGKYFVTGSQTNNANGYSGKVMALSSATGATIWQTPSIGLTFPGYGVDYLDDFTSASEMVNGKMFITGRSYVNATATNMRTLLVGVTDQGVVFMTKYLEFNPATAPDARFYGACIEYDGTDSLIILQHGDDVCMSSSCTDFKVGLVKTDLFGNVSWCKEYDVSSVASEVARGLTVTPNAYVFYGFGNYNQPNSRLFVLKTNKQGVIQASKLVSFGTGNIGHTCGPLTTTGSSVYKNGKHYIPGSYFTTNAASRDIVQLVLDDNLNDALGCFTVAQVAVSTTTHPPFSSTLNTNTPADQVAFNLNPAPALLTYNSPCTANVSFSQNSSCASSVITASVPSIANPIFVWSNGTTGSTVTASNNDTLFVTVLNPLSCCIVVDTIVPVFTTSNLSVQLPNDTSVCLGGTSNFTLNPIVVSSSTPLSYTWNNQSTNSTLTVNQAGTYWVSVFNGCQTVTDSIVITQLALPTATLSGGGSFCAGQPLDAILANFGGVAPWTLNYTINGVAQTPITSSNPTVSLGQAPGTYTLGALQDANCVNVLSASIQIQIVALPVLALNPLSVCEGSSGLLTSNVNTPGGTYLWQPGGQTTNAISVAPAVSTLYALTYTFNGCSAADSITVSVNPLPNVAFSADTLNGCAPLEVQFSSTTNGDPSTFVWTLSNGQNLSGPNPTYTFNQTGCYNVSLTVSLNGCPATATALSYICTDNDSCVVSEEEDLIYYVPNAFTPDGDQFNQVFLPVMTEGIDALSYQLQIYNRWGELIFESHDVQKGWDGTYPYDEGVVQDGLYIWRIQFALNSSNELQIITGHVSVLR